MFSNMILNKTSNVLAVTDYLLRISSLQRFYSHSKSPYKRSGAEPGNFAVGTRESFGIYSSTKVFQKSLKYD